MESLGEGAAHPQARALFAGLLAVIDQVPFYNAAAAQGLAPRTLMAAVESFAERGFRSLLSPEFLDANSFPVDPSNTKPAASNVGAPENARNEGASESAMSAAEKNEAWQRDAALRVEEGLDTYRRDQAKIARQVREREEERRNRRRERKPQERARPVKVARPPRRAKTPFEEAVSRLRLDYDAQKVSALLVVSRRNTLNSRLRVVLLAYEGKPYVSILQTEPVSERCATRWIAAFNEGGVEGIDAEPGDTDGRSRRGRHFPKPVVKKH